MLYPARMEITWLGHSCFLIKGKETAVLTDPCHPDFGYDLGQPLAHVVTVSHSHPGHNYVQGIPNTPRQLSAPGEYEIGGTFITGIAAFHDNNRGRDIGRNIIYLIEMDGIALCHLGDLGHPLSPRLIEELGDVDILFLPVGEGRSISVDLAAQTVKDLNPHIVLPMHYRTDSFSGQLATVDKFLDRMGIREAETKPKLLITSSSLPSSTHTVVLSHA